MMELLIPVKLTNVLLIVKMNGEMKCAQMLNMSSVNVHSDLI